MRGPDPKDSNSDDISIGQLLQRLLVIESLLHELIDHKTVKDWYTTTELATLLQRSEFTVREWCRHGRILASKRACGRGKAQEWIVSHNELQRYRNEGLLPPDNRYHHFR